jgi:hypothetical protein
MALPVFRGVGAKTTTDGQASPADPLGLAAGDLDILVAATQNAGTLEVDHDFNGGVTAYTALTGSPVSVASGCKLYIWYRVVVAGDITNEPEVIVTGSTPTCMGRLGYQTGTFNASSPLEIEATGAETTSDTSFSWAPGTTTGGADRLVLVVSTILRDSNTGSVPVCTNANLSSLASRINYNTNLGTGAGLGVTEGALATAGGVGTFACTYGAASPKAYASFAIKPPGASAHSVPINDSFQGTDAITTKAVTKPIADAFQGVDAISKKPGKGIADAFQGTDAITRKAVGKTVPDAFQGTDNFTRTVSYQRSVADAFQGVDNVTVAQPILLLIQDSFQGTDILTSKAVGKTVPDTIQGTDAISKRPSKAVADAFQGTDALTRKAVGKLLGDVLLGSDEIVVDFAPGPMVIQTSFPEGTEVHVYLLRNVQWWRELEQMPPDPGIAIATVASNGTLTFDPGLPPDTYSFWGEIEVPDGYLFLSGPTKAKTVARNVTVTIH